MKLTRVPIDEKQEALIKLTQYLMRKLLTSGYDLETIAKALREVLKTITRWQKGGCGYEYEK